MTAYSGQNKLSVMEFKKPFGPSLSVPNSRTNLWDGTPIGPSVNFGWKCSPNFKVLCAEQCFRVAHKLAMSSRDGHGLVPSPVGFMHGTEETDDSQTVLTFTTFDPGTLTSSGRLVPSSYLPDSIVASLYFKANTTSQAESVHAFSEEWFDGMLKNVQHLTSAHSYLHISQAWKVKFVCLHDGQSMVEDGIAQLLVHCLAVSVAPVAGALPVKPVPIIPTALAKSLSGPLTSYQSGSRSGFLTLNQARKLLLVLDSEPKLSQLPVVGVWISGIPSIRHYMVWLACLRFIWCKNMADRLVTPSGFFLILLYTSASAKPKFYKCKIHDLKNLKFEVQSAKYFIPNYTLSDSTPVIKFQLNEAAASQRNKLAFEKALQSAELLGFDETKPTSCDHSPSQLAREPDQFNHRSPLQPINAEAPGNKRKNAKVPRLNSQNILAESLTPSPVLQPIVRPGPEALMPSVPELSLYETETSGARNTTSPGVVFNYNSVPPQQIGSSPQLRPRKSFSPSMKGRQPLPDTMPTVYSEPCKNCDCGRLRSARDKAVANSPHGSASRTPEQSPVPLRSTNSSASKPCLHSASDEVFIVAETEAQGHFPPDPATMRWTPAPNLLPGSQPVARSPSLMPPQQATPPPFMKQPSEDLYVLLQQKDQQISQLQAYIEHLQQPGLARATNVVQATVDMATQTTSNTMDDVADASVQTDHGEREVVDRAVNTTDQSVENVKGDLLKVSATGEPTVDKDICKRSYRANESGHNTSWDSCSLKLDSSAVDRGTEGSSVTPRLIDLPGLEESEESHSATKDVWNQESPVLGESASTYMQESMNKARRRSREKQPDLLNDDSDFVENLLKQVHHMLHNTSGGSETAESSSESDAITRSKSSKGRASFPRRKTKRGLPAPLIPHLTYLSQLRDCGVFRTNDTSIFTGSASASELSMHANAIALKYLSDEQLSKIAANTTATTSGSCRATPQKASNGFELSANATMFMPGMSMISPNNMSLATKKYMKKYGLIPVKDGEYESGGDGSTGSEEEEIVDGRGAGGRHEESPGKGEDLTAQASRNPGTKQKGTRPGDQSIDKEGRNSWTRFEQNLGETVNMLVPFLKDLENNHQRSPSATTNDETRGSDQRGEPQPPSRAPKPGPVLRKSSRDLSGPCTSKPLVQQRSPVDQERGRSSSVDRVLSSQLLDVFARKHSRMSSLPRLPLDERRFVTSPSQTTDCSSNDAG